MKNQHSHYTLNDQSIPHFFYGTAWKEDKTAELTYQALEAGFTAIDTANQRKHYFEEAVGQGLTKFLENKNQSRKNIFLQTKYTYARGQDHRKPYNDDDSFADQVKASFASSLKHLNTDYIDSYVLHGPYSQHGIGPEDKESWAAMETLFNNKQVHAIGVSNISQVQLTELCKFAKVKPRFVQNRCYANTGWDKEVRQICQKENILYQGFSLLTANRQQLSSPLMVELAQKYNKTIPQIVFRFCQQLNMICLTGTTNPDHMKQDLDIYDFELNPDEMSMIETLGV